jgi:MtN3 and saliva related transmembrane protein
MLSFIDYIIDYQEILGFIAAALGSISFLPQVIKIWRLRSVKELSMSMYILYTISVVLWLIYGIIIKSSPLIIAEMVTLILVSTILVMKYLWK